MNDSRQVYCTINQETLLHLRQDIIAHIVTVYWTQPVVMNKIPSNTVCDVSFVVVEHSNHSMTEVVMRNSFGALIDDVNGNACVWPTRWLDDESKVNWHSKLLRFSNEVYRSFSSTDRLNEVKQLCPDQIFVFHFAQPLPVVACWLDQTWVTNAGRPKRRNVNYEWLLGKAFLTQNVGPFIANSKKQ